MIYKEKIVPLFSNKRKKRENIRQKLNCLNANAMPSKKSQTMWWYKSPLAIPLTSDLSKSKSMSQLQKNSEFSHSRIQDQKDSLRFLNVIMNNAGNSSENGTTSLII
jgi:hypothetical protein